MGRDDSGLGIMIDQAWVRLQLTLPKWPTFNSGPEILWNASGPNDGLRHSGTMIALGVEGEGGRRALEVFLHSMLGVQCAVTLDNRSVDKSDMASISYPLTPKRFLSENPDFATSRRDARQLFVVQE